MYPFQIQINLEHFINYNLLLLLNNYFTSITLYNLKLIIMANQTDPFAETIHGSNPQNLIEKITRLKIYNSIYWKEECFALTGIDLHSGTL